MEAVSLGESDLRSDLIGPSDPEIREGGDPRRGYK